MNKEKEYVNNDVTITTVTYNHLIKTTNVLRKRNRELLEENQKWRKTLINTKKLNRKQKRFLMLCIDTALLNDDFSSKHYEESMKIKNFLK